MWKLREYHPLLYLGFGQKFFMFQKNHIGYGSAPVALKLPEQFTLVKLNCIQVLLHKRHKQTALYVF